MVKPKDKYLKMRIGRGDAYIIPGCIEKLRKCDAIIFDCDGVLIDVRASYTKATIEAVKYFVNELTGIIIPSDDKINEIIYLFKKSGGFNNEWDIVYSILVFAFNRFPVDYQEEFVDLVNHGKSKEMRDFFYYVKDGLSNQVGTFKLKNVWKEVEEELLEFVLKRDSSGILSVEKELEIIPNTTGKTNERSVAVKQFLNYPGNVGESLLTTVFEEIFCGPQLFERVYKLKPRFYDRLGLIEEEKIILTTKSLTEIESRIERDNLGMATGRGYSLVKYTLGDTLDRFNSRACIFSDNIEEYERRKSNAEEKVNLKKPHPFSLLKAVEELNSFQFAMYVGDSMEDILMVKRANEVLPRFISVGVYAASDFREELILDFFEADTDVILPSVNELPYLIRKVQEENL